MGRSKNLTNRAHSTPNNRRGRRYLTRNTSAKEPESLLPDADEDDSVTESSRKKPKPNEEANSPSEKDKSAKDHSSSSSASHPLSSSHAANPNTVKEHDKTKSTYNVLAELVRNETRFDNFLDLNRVVYELQHHEDYPLRRLSSKTFRVMFEEECLKREKKNMSRQQRDEFEKQSVEEGGEVSKRSGKKAKHRAIARCFGGFDRNNPPVFGNFKCDCPGCHFQLNFKGIPKNGWTDKTFVQDLEYMLYWSKDKDFSHNHGNDKHDGVLQKYNISNPFQNCQISVSEEDTQDQTSGKQSSQTNFHRQGEHRSSHDTTQGRTSSIQHRRVFYVHFRMKTTETMIREFNHINCAIQWLLNIPRIHKNLTDLTVRVIDRNVPRTSGIIVNLLKKVRFEMCSNNCNHISSLESFDTQFNLFLSERSSSNDNYGDPKSVTTVIKIITDAIDDLNEIQFKTRLLKAEFYSTIEETINCWNRNCDHRETKTKDLFFLPLEDDSQKRIRAIDQKLNCYASVRRKDTANSGNYKCPKCGKGEIQILRKVLKAGKIICFEFVPPMVNHHSDGKSIQNHIGFPRIWETDNILFPKEINYQLCAVLYKSQKKTPNPFSLDVRHWQTLSWDHFNSSGLVKKIDNMELPGTCNSSYQTTDTNYIYSYVGSNYERNSNEIEMLTFFDQNSQMRFKE